MQESGDRELTTRIAKLKSAKASYEKLLSQLKITNTQEGTDAVRVALVREDLATLKGLKDAVDKRIEQLKFEARGEARISMVQEPRPAGILVSDSRKKLWAVTPVGVLGFVLGLFVLIEARAGRIADVDDLSRRVPMEVYAVPSLPGPRPASDHRACATTSSGSRNSWRASTTSGSRSGADRRRPPSRVAAC